jgi:hypothetical protein
MDCKKACVLFRETRIGCEDVLNALEHGRIPVKFSLYARRRMRKQHSLFGSFLSRTCCFLLMS